MRKELHQLAGFAKSKTLTIWRTPCVLPRRLLHNVHGHACELRELASRDCREGSHPQNPKTGTYRYRYLYYELYPAVRNRPFWNALCLEVSGARTLVEGGGVVRGCAARCAFDVCASIPRTTCRQPAALSRAPCAGPSTREHMPIAHVRAWVRARGASVGLPLGHGPQNERALPCSGVTLEPEHAPIKVATIHVV